MGQLGTNCDGVRSSPVNYVIEIVEMG